MDRWILSHWDDQIDAALVEREQRALFGVRYVDQAAHASRTNRVRAIVRLPPLSTDVLPKDAVDAVLARAAALKDEPFDRALGGRKLDYVVWDVAADPAWAFEGRTGFSRAFSTGDFVIYTVTQR